MHSETVGLIDRMRETLNDLLAEGADRAWLASTDTGIPPSYADLAEAVFKAGYLRGLADATAALRKAAGWD